MRDSLINWHEKFQPLGPALKTPRIEVDEKSAIAEFEERSFDHPSCTGGNAPSLSPQALVPSPAAQRFKVGDRVRSRKYSKPGPWSWGDLVVREIDEYGCRCDSKRGSGFFDFSDLEHISQPSDTQQWVEWKGGCRPVLPYVLVDIRVRDGRVLHGTACGFSWNHLAGYAFASGDIVAYRVVQ